MKIRLKRIAAAAAVSGAVLCGAAIAVQGSQADPLVTLSYLTDVFAPSVLTQVDARIQQSRQGYLDQLNASVDRYSAEMEALLGSSSGSAGQASAVFSVVDVPRGKQIIGEVGCEMMLRTGSASCTSPASPGLIDATDGTVLESGKALAKNHLYMVTVAERGATATADAKLLVRGAYTIK